MWRSKENEITYISLVSYPLFESYMLFICRTYSLDKIKQISPKSYHHEIKWPMNIVPFWQLQTMLLRKNKEYRLRSGLEFKRVDKEKDNHLNEDIYIITLGNHNLKYLYVDPNVYKLTTNYTYVDVDVLSLSEILVRDGECLFEYFIYRAYCSSFNLRDFIVSHKHEMSIDNNIVTSNRFIAILPKAKYICNIGIKLKIDNPYALLIVPFNVSNNWIVEHRMIIGNIAQPLDVKIVNFSDDIVVISPGEPLFTVYLLNYDRISFERDDVESHDVDLKRYKWEYGSLPLEKRLQKSMIRRLYDFLMSFFSKY